MIIEFFGTPGAGKSTLIRALLIDIPHMMEARANNRLDIALHAIRFALRHPRDFGYWISQVWIHSGGLLRYKSGLLLRACAAEMKARDKHASIVCIDEGLLQRVLSIFEIALTPAQMERALSHIPMPNGAIYMGDGDFSRFLVASDASDSPRVQQGTERLNKWMLVVKHNAALLASTLEKNISLHRCTKENGRNSARNFIEGLK